jgi:XTP/dITP diphosphohydrolase
MKKLLFATGNLNKLAEVRALLQGQYEVQSLHDLELETELPETQETLEGNALQKARYIVDHYGLHCFAEDTGLEVEALNGAPGVYSARYAGEEKNNQANCRKLLAELQPHPNRKARFRTVIALVLDHQEHCFEGIVEGKIIEIARGEGGFGYDPLFVADGCEQTFAEMPAQEKNQISHRGRALQKLIHFLEAQELS